MNDSPNGRSIPPRNTVHTTVTRPKRFGSAAIACEAQAITTTRDPTVRLLYVVVSLLLQNVWRYLHYEYVATPAEAGVASDAGRTRSSSI